MFSVFLLALALSVDAFAVAFSYGLVIKKDVASSAAKLGAATGAGQFVMPLLGWLATDSVHRYIEAFDHWIAFVVFLLLGLNVIRGALGGEECEKRSPKLSLKLLSVVAVATSIDIIIFLSNEGIGEPFDKIVVPVGRGGGKLLQGNWFCRKGMRNFFAARYISSRWLLFVFAGVVLPTAVLYPVSVLLCREIKRKILSQKTGKIVLKPVGLSMMCYTEGKEKRTCFGECQPNDWLPDTYYVTKGYAILKTNFATREEALKWVQELARQRGASGNSGLSRQLSRVRRTGPDYRGNRGCDRAGLS